MAPLTTAQKAVYSTGDFAEALVNVALAQYLLFYLTAVVGLPGSLAGLALALTLVIDAVADPLIGYVSDNARFSAGRRHPFIVASALPLALSVGLLFSIPKIESTALLFAYVFAVLLLLRISYSFFALPYIALGAELSRDYTERSMLQVYRNFLNICGNLLTVVLGFGLFLNAPGALTDRSAYIPLGWTLAALIALTVLASALGTLNLRHRMYKVAAPDRSALARLPGELRDVFRNHSFIVLLLTIVIFWVAQGTALNLGVYNYTYFWKVGPDVIQTILVSGTAGLFTGIPLCAFLLRRLEKKDICTGGIVVVCALLFAPALLNIAGMMPADPASLQIVLCAFSFVTSLGLTNAFISFNSMMVDAADEHELLFGVRREGLYFAALSFSGKAALGIGAFVAGIALDFVIGFPRDIATNPGAALTSETVIRLGLIAGPGAALISAMSAFAMARYRVSRVELTRIQGELARRSTATP